MSGTGVVAEGCQFANGIVAMTWKSEHFSGTFFLSIDTVQNLHGHGGRTVVEWIDPDPRLAPAANDDHPVPPRQRQVGG